MNYIKNILTLALDQLFTGLIVIATAPLTRAGYNLKKLITKARNDENTKKAKKLFVFSNFRVFVIKSVSGGSFDA